MELKALKPQYLQYFKLQAIAAQIQREVKATQM